MFCPRLDHFTRLNDDGTIGKCGHMRDGKGFDNFASLQESDWLRNIKDQMSKNIWPNECVRCKQTESLNQKSIRTKSIDRHKILHPLKQDYIIVGGTLDNVCNSACQTCNSKLSTKIGSLETKYYEKVNNLQKFYELPQERILEIDVNGGEPTASPNYKKLISDVPANVKIVRMNTNGSRMIAEIENLLKKGIMVIVTLSLDGTDAVHDYVRWPIKWVDYCDTVQRYLVLRKKYKLLKLDFWTTVSCLNVANLDNIIKFAEGNKVVHDFAFLSTPKVFNVKYKNRLTNAAKHIAPDLIATDRDNTEELELYIKKQDYLRKIDIRDYLNF